ncbi:AEC family transporter [Lysobacter korlensis]|uniref:AEC family transporter n=1 Tax=Lysobacter korlensis TaxID=553636 RepID=A0ABV6RTY3_9GAMM
MTGVLLGFFVIGVMIAVGFVTGRLGVLGEHGRTVLARLVFFVLSPFLLFTVLAEADVNLLFSSLLAVSVIAAFACFLIYGLVSSLIWRRSATQTVVGSLASGYVNANNIGIPVSLYVLGNAAYSAPLLLLQLLVITPVALGILDASSSGSRSVGKVLLRMLTNPMIVGSALGVLLSAIGVQLPDAVMEPFRLIGAAAIPVMLVSFGMSLSGSRLLAPGTGRRDVLLAVTLKLTIMPLIAWAAGRFWFGLDGQELFVVTVLAALPAAQNVFNYAQRYERGEIVARDAVLLTTIGSVPALLLVAALLAP